MVEKLKLVTYNVDNDSTIVESSAVGSESTLEGAATKVSVPVMDLFNKVLENVSPVMEIRARRIGGANYQVPREVRPERRVQLALRWIIEASRAKKGKAMAGKLEEELVLAFKGEGSAVKKKEETHRMADANKAFAHFTW